MRTRLAHLLYVLMALAVAGAAAAPVWWWWWP